MPCRLGLLGGAIFQGAAVQEAAAGQHSPGFYAVAAAGGEQPRRSVPPPAAVASSACAGLSYLWNQLNRRLAKSPRHYTSTEPDVPRNLNAPLHAQLPAHADNFIETPSGLRYLDIKEGEGGNPPRTGDTCVVHWAGKSSSAA
jgi:hypothetical protein